MTKRKMKILILIMPLIILALWVFHKSSLISSNNYLTDIISNLDDVASNYGFGYLQMSLNSLLDMFNIESVMCGILAWYFSYLIIVEFLFVIYKAFTLILDFLKVGDY